MGLCNCRVPSAWLKDLTTAWPGRQAAHSQRAIGAYRCSCRIDFRSDRRRAPLHDGPGLLDNSAFVGQHVWLQPMFVPELEDSKSSALCKALFVLGHGICTGIYFLDMQLPLAHMNSCCYEAEFQTATNYKTTREPLSANQQPRALARSPEVPGLAMCRGGSSAYTHHEMLASYMSHLYIVHP